MAHFYFAAQDKNRNIVQGDLEALDRDDAFEILAKRDLSPLRLDLIKENTGGFKFLKFNISLGGGLDSLDEITLVRHLGTVMNAGTDLVSGLTMIGEDAVKPFVRKMVLGIKDRMLLGEKFSDALLPWKDQFNPLFLSLVRAGEASGTLPETLLSYANQLRKDNAFIRRLKSALVYPVILVVALITMLILILTVVTPRLKELFATTRSAPPFYTQVFFFASDFLLSHFFAVGLIGGVILLGLAISLANKKTRRKVATVLWYLPFLNKIQRNLTLMRFCKTISSLIGAGFSLKAALGTASEVAGAKFGPVLLEIANEKLERGIGFGAAIGEYPKFFPKILVSVLKTAEKSGQIRTVMAQMGDFYEEEVIYALELFLTLIEPTLLLIVGLIVGLIASSLIAPIYRLIGSIR